MIKENELRENIWVVIDGKNEQLDQDALEIIFASRNYSDLSPIPLTPEILEKAGFALTEETGHSWLTVFEGYVHIGYMFKKFPLVLDIDDSRMPLHQIKYVHQLQNLYFALTGEELTVNFKELTYQ